MARVWHHLNSHFFHWFHPRHDHSHHYYFSSLPPVSLKVSILFSRVYFQHTILFSLFNFKTCRYKREEYNKQSCIQHQPSTIINILHSYFPTHCPPSPSPPEIPLHLRPDQITLMLTTFPKLLSSVEIEVPTSSTAHTSDMIFLCWPLCHLTMPPHSPPASGLHVVAGARYSALTVEICTCCSLGLKPSLLPTPSFYINKYLPWHF